MRINLFTIGFVLLLWSCHTNRSTPTQEAITGELYFKLIDFSSLYGVPDSTAQLFQNYIDSLAITPDISEQDSQFLAMVQLLKNHELLNKPTIHLRIDSTTIITAYLNEQDYELVKKFDRQELINENKKVEISLKGMNLGNNIFRSESITSTNIIDGKTYWKK